MISYHNEISQLLKINPSKTDWDKELSLFIVQLRNLQNERLMHLLVMLFVGIATLISLLFTFLYQNLALVLFDISLVFLFIGYLLYYRKLENTVQNAYLLLEELHKKTVG
jgi:hypothetical protein